MRPLVVAAAALPLLATTLAAGPATAAPVPAAVSATAVAAKKAPKATRKTTAMGAVAMRTKGTRYSPTRAASRLENWARKGVGGYHNGCLRLADNAYQPRGGRTSTALSQWSRAKRKGFAHPKDRRPLVGAQMFWRTSNPAGHVATYVGGGKAVTNMPGGRVKKVNWRLMNRWGPYLGWAEPYYG